MKKIMIMISLLALSMIALACTPMLDGPLDITFEQCVEAGGEIAESYPRQCRINGQMVVEEIVEEILPTVEQLCQSLDGTWIAEAEECEGIAKDSCDALGGTINECASACRNDPEAEMCTMQCVLVCELGEEKEETNPIPEGCITWYDGCNTCGVENGNLTMCTLMYCEEPMGEAKCLLFDTDEPVVNMHTCTDEEKANMICTREYIPVCGNDGKTYGNGCTACSFENVISWTDGEC